MSLLSLFRGKQRSSLAGPASHSAVEGPASAAPLGAEAHRSPVTPPAELSAKLFSAIACLKCRGFSLSMTADDVRCGNCGARYRLDGGILDFVREDDLSQLEKLDYDKVHKLTVVANSPEFLSLIETIKPLLRPKMTAVEIGCGTGAWTVGLSQHDSFESMIATDISRKFLRTLQGRLSTGKTVLAAADLNVFDLSPGSVDAVFGRSILHHVYEYPAVLERARTWLRPGGFAVFFEPVLEGKALMAFFMEAIRRLDRRLELKVFTEAEHKKIEGMVNHIKKELRLRDKPEVIKTLEDKFIFRLDEMKKLAGDLGYARFEFKNAESQPDLSCLRYLKWTLGIHIDLDGTRLQKFLPLFEAYRVTVGELFPDRFIAPMGYFIFQR